MRVKKTKFTKHPILLEKKRIAQELFGGRCAVCLKPYGKGFSFHHIEYRSDRLRSRDFKTTVTYHIYVLPEIKDEPWRFLLVCQAHHHYLEWGASIKNVEMWDRYLKAVEATRLGHKKEFSKMRTGGGESPVPTQN